MLRIIICTMFMIEFLRMPTLLSSLEPLVYFLFIFLHGVRCHYYVSPPFCCLLSRPAYFSFVSRRWVYIYIHTVTAYHELCYCVAWCGEGMNFAALILSLLFLAVEFQTRENKGLRISRTKIKGFEFLARKPQCLQLPI